MQGTEELLHLLHHPQVSNVGGERNFSRLLPEQFELGTNKRIAIALDDLDVDEVKFISKEPSSGNILLGLSFHPMKISHDDGSIFLLLRESSRPKSNVTNILGCHGNEAHGMLRDLQDCPSKLTGVCQTRVKTSVCHLSEEHSNDEAARTGELLAAHGNVVGELPSFTTVTGCNEIVNIKTCRNEPPEPMISADYPSVGQVQLPVKSETFDVMDVVTGPSSAGSGMTSAGVCDSASASGKQILRHACPQCDMSFEAEDLLTSHLLNQHSGVKPWGCPYCGQRTAFVSRSELRDHQRVAHPDKREQSIMCDECGQAFGRKSRLRDHKLAYHTGSGERRFVCTVNGCGKRYRYQRHLRRHEHSHGDPETARKYACDSCPLRFARRSQYKEHLNKHTGQKPFLCSECGRSFSHSSTLWAHKKRHEEATKTYSTRPSSVVSMNSTECNYKDEMSGPTPQAVETTPPPDLVIASETNTLPPSPNPCFTNHFSHSVFDEIFPKLLANEFNTDVFRDNNEIFYSTSNSSLESSDFMNEGQ